MTVVGFVIKLSPYSIKLHDMKVCGRVEIPNFSTEAGEGAASHAGAEQDKRWTPQPLWK